MPEFKRISGSGTFDQFVKILKEQMDERKRLEDAKFAHNGKGKSVRATLQQGRSFANVYGTNKCLFWNCTRAIRKDHILCSDHYEDLQDGLIDECKACGLAKEKQYSLCLTCANKPSTSSRSGKPGTQQKYTWYKEEYSPAWKKGDKDATRFFVYILKFSDGSFYAGQTRDLRLRKMEHKDNTTQSTKDRIQKLVWFHEVPTRNEAAKQEVELKKLIDSNPREIRRKILDLKDLVSELDYT